MIPGFFHRALEDRESWTTFCVILRVSFCGLESQYFADRSSPWQRSKGGVCSLAITRNRLRVREKCATSEDERHVALSSSWCQCQDYSVEES